MSIPQFAMAYYQPTPAPARRLIRDLPAEERPLHRLNLRGPEALNNAELLALILGSADGLDLAEELLISFGSLHQLARAGPAQLGRIRGIGRAQAARLAAVLELGRRLQQPPAAEPYWVHSPADAAHLLMPEMRDLAQEELRVMVLDNRNRILKTPTIYKGSANASLIRLAEIFRPAIELHAPAIIVAHNHPSGDPAPSPEDVQVTREMVRAGELLDIKVLDHVIIGAGRFVSLKERGLGFD